MNQNQMVLHCGGRVASYEEICSVPLPEETDTYIPVSFGDIIKDTRLMADNFANQNGFEFKDGQYALAAKDQRMFAILQYIGDNENMGWAIGIRSSYDKSMSNGLAFGSKLFVCDNLSFKGKVTVMRKHTRNVKEDLQKEILHLLFTESNNFHDIVKDREKMINIPMNDDKAYEFFGRMLGYRIITPRQVTKALNHWRNAPYEEFKERNMWSVYNSCTESLKSTPPQKVLESHIKLHQAAIA
tara:strand:- start:17081 stop:17806 length:726 start_codon:yes stop_codon:yes gene_type:complete